MTRSVGWGALAGRGGVGRALLVALCMLPACTPADGDRVDGIQGAVHRYVDVGSTRWHYLQAGSGDPVVLLHGMLESAWAWRYQIPALATEYRVIVPDLKGFGLSGKEEGDYSFAAVAGEIAQLLSSIGVERFRLVGHDWGALIAARLGADHPHRVVGYVHVSAALQQLDLSRWNSYRDFYFDPDQVAGFLRSPEAFMSRLFESSLDQGLSALTPEALERHVTEFSRRGVADAVGRYFRDMDLAKDWSLGPAMAVDWTRTQFPVRIIIGDHDYRVPGELFLDAEGLIPGFERLVIMDDCGHYPAEEHPDLFTKLLQEFLAQL